MCLCDEAFCFPITLLQPLLLGMLCSPDCALVVEYYLNKF